MTAEVLAQSFALVFDPYVLWVVAASAAFGLFVGAVPGLTATMATALLVPATFFMPPIPAIASMVTATAMAIFAGDIPSCLLRIPGTPASAAYTDEAYALTRKGQGELSLGAGLVFSVIGGLFGTLVLILAAPMLAEFALRFSSFEYFWLTLLGLSCAVFIAQGDKLKGMISLLIGLLVATVGLDNPAAFPRFTFGLPELMGGAELIPIMVGMFAVSEVMRSTITVAAPLETAQTAIGNVFTRHVGAPEEVSAADAARQPAGHADRRLARRRRRHRGLDVLCHEQEASRRNRRSSAPAISRASSNQAPPTTAHWPAPGSRPWCSASRAIRSRPS